MRLQIGSIHNVMFWWVYVHKYFHASLIISIQNRTEMSMVLRFLFKFKFFASLKNFQTPPPPPLCPTKNTRGRCEICLKLTLRTPERRQ